MKKIILTSQMSEQGSLILVNRLHPLKGKISSDSLRPFGPSVLLEKKTSLVLEHLFSVIGCDSTVVPVSGFRTQDEQKAIFASSLAEHGEAFTKKYVALPGCSEHQTGLAVDLALNQRPIDFIRPYFPKEGVCLSLRSRMASWGFVERYPAGKEEITGISAEPWHFRYVGIPHASLMKRHGFCLEEYLEYLREFPFEGKHLEVQSDNKTFEIFYKKSEGETTEIALPDYLPYQVSGTNTGGFVFTIWR